MKLRGPTEHAIYAAAYVHRLAAEQNRGDYARHATTAEWLAWCSDVAISAALEIVRLHRNRGKL